MAGLLLTLTGLTAPSSSRAQTTPSLQTCTPASAKNIRRTREVVVFAWHHKTYACLRDGSKAPRQLPTYPSNLTATSIAKTKLAYAVRTGPIRDSDSYDYVLYVLDVRTGRTVRTAEAANRGPATDSVPGLNLVGVTDLVVTARGSIAWIYQEDRYTDPPEYQVYRSYGSMSQPGAQDDLSATRFVGQALDIEPTSLQVGANRFSWTQGGQVRSGYLP